MITPCPHCQVQIEIDPPTLAALAGCDHFNCPTCQGEVPVPGPQGESVVAPCLHCGEVFELDLPTIAALRAKVVFPCPICSRMLPTSMFHTSGELDAEQSARAAKKPVATPGWKPPATGQRKAAKTLVKYSKVLSGMNRNFLILGAAALLMLGGIGFFLASRSQGNTMLTREGRIREMIRNRYFSDLIAAGKADKKALLALWDIRPFGTGFIGITGKTAAWEQAPALAREVGAGVLRLDPPDTAARTALMDWLPAITEELAGETHWLLDHGEPKTVSAPVVNRVSTMDRERRVMLHWDNPSPTP